MPMRIGTAMPSLDGATEWFNATEAHAVEESKGRPTLVYFWSVSCGICKENMPKVAEWRDRKDRLDIAAERRADAKIAGAADHLSRGGRRACDRPHP